MSEISELKSGVCEVSMAMQGEIACVLSYFYTEAAHLKI